MIFGVLNSEKIWHKILDLSTSLVRCSHFTLWYPKKSHSINSIVHTYFWLFTLSQKKNCNPLAHPTWNCHHTNSWIAKLFHLTEGLLRSFKRWRLWRESVSGTEKNRLLCVATGMSGKQCHSKCSNWPPSALIHAFSLFRHWSVA